MKHAEQIGRYNGPAARRHLKKVQRRSERRGSRRMLEDAPVRRRYSGWGHQ